MTNPIGPQRAAPASPARIAAKVAETKRQISEAVRPTRDHFRTLGAVDFHSGTIRLRELVWWQRGADCPCIVLHPSTIVDIKTVGHLRAVCEMLGIEWK